MAAFHDKSLVTDEVVRARFEDRIRANDGYTIQRHLSDHRAPYSVQGLSAIKVPALFVWCQEDSTLVTTRIFEESRSPNGGVNHQCCREMSPRSLEMRGTPDP